MLMDPHPSQQNAGLQHAVLPPQFEVTYFAIDLQNFARLGQNL